jgi:hypothetical protein
MEGLGRKCADENKRRWLSDAAFNARRRASNFLFELFRRALSCSEAA